jgi:hypothetical protein
MRDAYGRVGYCSLNRVLPCEQFLFALVRFVVSVM